MEITKIALGLSVLGSIISVMTLVLNRRDKAVSETKENNYELIKYQVSEIKEDVKEILSKLDKFDEDIDKRIEKAIKLHVELYHHKGGV